jgi:hypothetical protein
MDIFLILKHWVFDIDGISLPKPHVLIFFKRQIRIDWCVMSFQAILLGNLSFVAELRKEEWLVGC